MHPADASANNDWGADTTTYSIPYPIAAAVVASNAERFAHHGLADFDGVADSVGVLTRRIPP